MIKLCLFMIGSGVSAGIMLSFIPWAFSLIINLFFKIIRGGL